MHLKFPTVREISVQDDKKVACLIRQVMTEFGANKEGFAFVDPEVASMSQHYQSANARYFVVEAGGTIYGGAGFAPLGIPGVAELRKMYFLPEARGRGWGRLLIEHIFKSLIEAGYQGVYLETTETMLEAQKLYGRVGFSVLTSPMGNTGHFGCKVWMFRPLP